MEQEQEIRTTKLRNNKSKKRNKEENIENLRKVGEIWTTYRWITEYIQENNEKWEEDLTKFKETEYKQLEIWDKLTRKEKIKGIMNNMEQNDQTNNMKQSLVADSSIDSTPPIIVADSSPTAAEVKPPGSHQNPKKLYKNGFPGGLEKLESDLRVPEDPLETEKDLFETN